MNRALSAGTSSRTGVVRGYLDAGADHVAIYVTDDRPLRQFERLMSVLAAAGVPARA
jgi:hypothetical protein